MNDSCFGKEMPQLTISASPNDQQAKRSKLEEIQDIF